MYLEIAISQQTTGQIQIFLTHTFPNLFMYAWYKVFDIYCTVWKIQGGAKNVAVYFCPYIRQLLIDFQNSFTATLCRQFAITWLLHFPPHHKCVSTLTYETSMKYALCIHNDNNKQTFW